MGAVSIRDDAEDKGVLQVEEEMEELKDIYRRRPEEEEQGQSSWKGALQRLVSAQELGRHYVYTVTTVTRHSGLSFYIT